MRKNFIKISIISLLILGSCQKESNDLIGDDGNLAEATDSKNPFADLRTPEDQIYYLKEEDSDEKSQDESGIKPNNTQQARGASDRERPIRGGDSGVGTTRPGGSPREPNCEVVTHNISATYSRYNVLTPESNIMYLGSLFDGNSIQTGEYRPLFFDGANPAKPLTYTVSLQGVSGSLSETMVPSRSNYLNYVNRVQNQNISGEQPAHISYEIVSIRSQSELAVNLGVTLSVTSRFSTHLNFDKSSTDSSNYYLIKLQQKYFTADIDIPSDGNLFNRPVNFSGNVAPVYISSIDYGRSAYMIIESKYSENDIKTVIGMSLEAWVVKATANYSNHQKNVLNSMKINGYAYGGNSSDAALGIAGISGFQQYVTNHANYSKDSRGGIIAYTLRNVANHGVYRITMHGEYQIRNCK